MKTGYHCEQKQRKGGVEAAEYKGGQCSQRKENTQRPKIEIHKANQKI